MKLRSLVILICIACVLAGCAITKPQPVTYRASGRDQKLIIYKEGGYAMRTRFVANGTYVCYEEYRWKSGPTDGNGFDLEYQVQYVPKADEWRKFWQAVDGLKLLRWKARYIQGDVPLPPGFDGDRVVVVDAGDWSLTYSTPQNKVESKGEGSFPVLDHPERTSGPGAGARREKDARQPLEAAFRELLQMPAAH